MLRADSWKCSYFTSGRPATPSSNVFLGDPANATCDPANIEAIQSTNFNGNYICLKSLGTIVFTCIQDWGMGPRRAITLPMFGDGIFTQEGAAWKHSREILRPQFLYKQYADLEVFKQAVEDLLEAISNVATKAGGSVDLQPLFFRLTLDTTTSFLFGDSVRCLKQPEDPGEETFAGAFNIAQEYVAKRFRVADFVLAHWGMETRLYPHKRVFVGVRKRQCNAHPSLGM